MKQILFVLSVYLFLGPSMMAQKQKVWLDSDTGNEMDDLFALARIIKDTTIDLIGVSSAHFNNPDLLVFEKWNAYHSKGLNTVAESQRLNVLLLEALYRPEINHPVGADRQIGRAWGQQDPRDSPAAREIIKAANQIPANGKLDIIVTGALTNIASAVILAPEILSKIRCFALGANYNPETKVWNKNEFNIRNDLNAFDYLLNREGFSLTIMPIDAARKLIFIRDLTFKKLKERIPVHKILSDRWREQNPQDSTRIIWDLALVEAYLKPDLAVLISADTPPENVKRKIWVYQRIDAEGMERDFWTTLGN